MPNLDWNRQMWTDESNWTTAGEEWSSAWGDSEAQWFGSLYPRLHRILPAETILEIAPGFGRWTKFLLPHCRQYTGLDLSATCIGECQRRFSDYTHATFLQNDGLSLHSVPDESVDLVFSFDSLVHCEIEVFRSYIPQILHKLRPAGLAFIHHSNLFAVRASSYYLDHYVGPQHPLDFASHHRARSVSARHIAALVAESGGQVLLQEMINWGTDTLDDCITVFGKSAAFAGSEAITLKNPAFMWEAGLIKRFQHPYSSHLARCAGSARRTQPADAD